VLSNLLECISITQLPLSDYFQTEEGIIQLIEGYYSPKVVTSNSSTPESDLERMTNELTRLQHAYVIICHLCLVIYVRILVEKERVHRVLFFHD
jgi:hypothetical protein